jgi:hypothetical protein
MSRSSLGRTPYFQEFYVTIGGDSLGLEVQKVHDVPVVRRLLRQNSRFIGPAEKGGASIGSLVAAVGSTPTLGVSYEDVVKKIKQQPRPFELTFRRLHAVRDPQSPHHGRLWQGLLYLFQLQHWTGRFYLLRASGELQAFAGTDDSVDGERQEGATKIESIDESS